jgi:hydrogenase small subunit
MTPFYRRLPNVPGFGIETTADKVGIGVAAGAAAALAAHGILRAAKGKCCEKSEPEEKEEK